MRRFDVVAKLIATTASAAVAVLAAGAGVASATTVDPGGGGAHAASSYTIRYQVYDALPASALTLDSHKITSGDWRSGAQGANLARKDDFTLTSNGGLAKASVGYKIGDTGYKASLWAQRDWLGTKESHCEVTDPAGKVVTSPYKCEFSHTDGADMDAYFVVEPSAPMTHVVTNNDEFNRRDMLDAWCGGDSKYARCDAVTVSNIDDSLGLFTPSSDTLINCTSLPSSQAVQSTDTTGETDTLGTKVEVSGTLFDVIQTKLEVSYQHAWTRSHTESRTVTLNAAPEEYGWIASAQRMQNVTGDFVATLGNQRYEVRDVTISAPMPGNGNNIWVTKTEKIADPAGVCSGKNGSILQKSPTAPVAGGLYRIGVAGANQHMIEAPDGTRQDSPLQLGQSSGARSQQWRFVEWPNSPYFEIHSDNNPNLCLDQSTRPNTQEVLQAGCWGGDNQLWSVTYDPAGNGFVLSSKLSPDRALSAEGGATANGTKLVASSTTGASRWSFVRAG